MSNDSDEKSVVEKQNKVGLGRPAAFFLNEISPLLRRSALPLHFSFFYAKSRWVYATLLFCLESLSSLPPLSDTLHSSPSSVRRGRRSRLERRSGHTSFSLFNWFFFANRKMKRASKPPWSSLAATAAVLAAAALSPLLVQVWESPKQLKNKVA